MSFEKIAIIGCGQIGTSAALALAAKNPNAEIICYDQAAGIENEFKAAMNKACVDTKGTQIKFTTQPEDVRDAEIIILATPVSKFAEAIETIAPYVTTQAIFTDVGSVKELSMLRIREALDVNIGRETAYVPFHILNGNAGSGPGTAAADIFKAPAVLVPGQVLSGVEKQVEEFWQSTDAIIHKIPARQHDIILGTTSHLEHVIIFSWMKTQQMSAALNQRGLTDFGGWVQAMTRIADAGPEMWSSIFNDNRNQILKTAGHFCQSLIAFSTLAENKDPSLQEKIDGLHTYAKDKVHKRITARFTESINGQDSSLSAFAGLLSMAIAANAQRVEQETGQSLAPLANPSFKDGIGPVAVDPENVRDLLQIHASALKPMVNDFLRQFDVLLLDISRDNSLAVKKLVAEVKEKRALLKDTFASPGKMAASATAAAPSA